MKKHISKIIPILLVNILIFSSVVISGSRATSIEITPEYGDPPTIDGSVEEATDEWENAKLYNSSLKKTASERGLPIEVKCIQDDYNLYLLIQFQIDQSSVKSENFLAILISNSTSGESEDFMDAKIINVSDGQSSYDDFYLNDSVYVNDTVHGYGQGNTSSIENFKLFTFEFSLPLQISESQVENEDIPLLFGSSYLFNISHGNIPNLPEGIIRSTNITINILEEKSEPPLFNIDIVELTFTIIIFSIIGVFYIFYIYQILLLRKKMERI